MEFENTLIANMVQTSADLMAVSACAELILIWKDGHLEEFGQQYPQNIKLRLHNMHYEVLRW